MEKLVVCVVVCSLWTSKTVAQNTTVAISNEEQYKQLKLEYESIDMASPALGVVVSTAAIAGGPVLIGLGDLDGLLSDEPLSRRGKGMMAGGALLLTAGFVGLIASSVFLRRNARKRRELRRRMAFVGLRSEEAVGKAPR